MKTDRNGDEQRILLLTPAEGDAATIQPVLEQAGLHSIRCVSLEELCVRLDEGAGAVILVEEAIVPDGQRCFDEWLARQPAWSDLPVLVLARAGADSAAVAKAMDQLGNVTVLERPTRTLSLVSATRAALRARARQYQLRDQLSNRERNLEAQALLAAIVSSSDDAIVSKTLDGRILSWNAGAERLFGYSSEEAVGRPILLLIPPERQNEEATILQRLRAGERIDHFETVRRTKDGRLIDVSVTVSPVRDSNGVIVGASKIARDIGESKRAAETLREADRRKNEFLAMLAHELRNPLAPIRNSLHILRLLVSDNPTADSAGEMMERQVAHMVRLVDDLMEVSRITRGSIELRRERLEVAAIVRSAVDTSRPAIDSARHQLVIAVPSESLSLDGDPVRLTQVIANMLNNAAKYTEPGGRINLTIQRDHDDVLISVKDNGMGIPADMLPHVFEPFVQGGRATPNAQGGLGIGLTLVKRLVELHGGSVEGRSDGPGRGSEFVIRLPLVPQAPALDALERPGRRSAILTSRRVLVVDDNRDAAESMRLLLELLGAEVRVAYSGAGALDMVAGFQPAAVLLDIGMPGMDGHEVARRIRERPELRDIMLIALTGWGQDEDRRRSQLAGFDHHLIKPADVRTLEALLASLGGRAADGPRRHH